MSENLTIFKMLNKQKVLEMSKLSLVLDILLAKAVDDSWIIFIAPSSRVSP